ncbi:MAG TPA: hypothetical protein VGK67_34245 [Myxococcales bacterium]|jgi:hypothetical protein
MPHPFAYSPDGAHLVSADGSELLVYDGPSEGPLWRKALPGPVLAVGVTEREIVSLDELGTLTRWKKNEPVPVEAVELGAIPEGLAVSADGTCVAWSDGALHLVEPGKPPRSLEFAGATAAGFGPNQTLAVGFDDGAVRLLQLPGGELLRTTRVESRVVGLGYSALGAWFVAAGNALFHVLPKKEAELYRRYAEEKVESLACSPDGTLLACRLAGRKVVVLAFSTHEQVAVIEYLEREVGEVAFGPWPWLGVGLDLGDGNKIDLDSGRVHRTDEHPGRPHNSWALQADVKPGVALRALKKAAELVSPAPAVQVAPEPAASGGSGINWHWIAVGVGILIAIVKLLAKH